MNSPTEPTAGKGLSARLSWRVMPVSWLAVIVLLLVFPLGFALPPEAAWENSLIEWLQTAILFMTAVAAGVAALKGPGTRETRLLWAWSVPVWLIMVGRELSWGRVFFTTGIGPMGPEFLSRSQFKFGWLLNPLLGFALVFIVVMIIYQRLHLEAWRWLRTAAFPAVDWSVGLLSVAIFTVMERHLTPLPEPRAMVIEELGELACYMAALTIVIAGGFYREFQPRGPTAAARNRSN